MSYLAASSCWRRRSLAQLPAADTPILRQQMKWVTRGATLAIAPFTLFYVIPYLYGAVPRWLMKVSVLSLVFLPLTFGYAIFRYRLMDVDLIFKRGMAYTHRGGAHCRRLLCRGGPGGRDLSMRDLPSAGPVGMIVAIVVTALLFDPFKNWFQERLDRFFYRKRYDYRTHTDRVRPRSELPVRSRPDADLHRRSPVAHAAGGPHGDLPVEPEDPEQFRAGEVLRHRRTPASST